MYGHRGGSTVCAELLQAVFLHAAQLGSGELDGVLEGRVGVAHAARHGGDPQVIHWHVALTHGRPHLLTGFGTGGSQNSRYVSPSVVRLQDDQQYGKNDDDAYDDDSDHRPGALDEYLLSGLCDDGCAGSCCDAGDRRLI